MILARASLLTTVTAAATVPAVALVALTAVAGCGGSGASARPAATSGTGASPETFEEVQQDDVAALGGAEGAGGGGGAAPAPADADPDPDAAGASDADEPPDDCAPVAVEFEKSVRPELKACYREGKKKDPNLEGTVRIGIDVDTLGKVKTPKILEKTLPDKVAQCMLKAVKAAPTTELSKCPGKSLTIPITFPTP